MLTESQKSLADEVCRTTLFYTWKHKPRKHHQLIISPDPDALITYIHRTLAISLSKRRRSDLNEFLAANLPTAQIKVVYPPVMTSPNAYLALDIMTEYGRYQKIYVDHSHKEALS